jgi:CubicO group peptidase (beta-lactamase class C family)
MKHTGSDAAGSAGTEHATGYRTILGTTPLETTSVDPSLTYAAGALYSTVGDLYTWDQALAGHKLVSQSSLDAMFTPFVPVADGSPVSYGYGWFLVAESGHELIFHDGSLPGFESINIRVPDAGLTVIVLSNESTADSTDIGLVLADDALGVSPGIAAQVRVRRDV